MRGVLRGVLALQVAFFAMWGHSLESAFVPGAGRDDKVATVWLATEPVDPRDLLAGHFVALRYGIMDPEHAKCATPLVADRVYVELAPSGKRVATTEGEVEIADAVSCRTDAPPPGDGHVWIVGRRDATPGRIRLVYGIERMYVAESSPLRTAKSGDVVAKVAVNAKFAPRLMSLVATFAAKASPPPPPPAAAAGQPGLAP